MVTTHIHRSDAEISEYLQRYRASNQSQSEFCREHELPRSTFNKWVNKHSSVKEGLKCSFIELKPTPREKLCKEPSTLNISIKLGSLFELSYRR